MEQRPTDHAGRKNGKGTDDRSAAIEKEEAREDAKVSPPRPYEIDLVGERKEAVVMNEPLREARNVDAAECCMDHLWVGASRVMNRKG